MAFGSTIGLVQAGNNAPTLAWSGFLLQRWGRTLPTPPPKAKCPASIIWLAGKWSGNMILLFQAFWKHSVCQRFSLYKRVPVEGMFTSLPWVSWGFPGGGSEVTGKNYRWNQPAMNNKLSFEQIWSLFFLPVSVQGSDSKTWAWGWNPICLEDQVSNDSRRKIPLSSKSLITSHKTQFKTIHRECRRSQNSQTKLKPKVLNSTQSYLEWNKIPFSASSFS